MTETEKVVRLSRAHLYAEDRLGMKLHPKQAAVLRDLFKKKGARVSFRCANEVGKTSRVATAAILFALEILKAQVISTAGVWMQVTEQLMTSLRKYRHLWPAWGFHEATISIGGNDRYVGFSTRDEGFAQGFHRDEGKPLLAIIDEAAAVADPIFNGVEDRCNPDFLLVMGSPLDPVGRFYDIETKLAKFYTHHHLGQPECTTDKAWWIDPLEIQRKIAKWGGEDNPFIQSNVFGNFAARVLNALLSLSEFESCLANPPDYHPGHEDRHGFIDFAAGRNKNVFAARVGNRIWIEKKWAERNTMAAVGECLAVFKKLEREYGFKPEEIDGDADGLGLVMIQRLREMGLNIGEFHGGGKPRFDPERYANAVSEAWCEGAGKIIRRDSIIPADADFRGQTLSRLCKRNSSGKFQLESKEDMAARGLESPDEGDAVFGAMMPATIQASVSLLPREPDSRGWLERARDEEPVGDIPGAFVT